MRLNENTKIIGSKTILIPYEAHHVPKYHEWMKTPELQELTASEPLTLEEEYEMQQSWREDSDKCTFLILDKLLYETTDDEIQSLIGDTNLFIQIEDDGCKVGEAEIMIAETGSRGKGLGLESLLLMLKYGADAVKCNKFIARIGESNSNSINLFKKIKFVETSRSTVFKEITFEKEVDPDYLNWINGNVCCTVEPYRIYE